MIIKRYQIDAFADKVFAGNPAAVCPLEQWLPDSVMQNIAMENNLSETAFCVKEKEGWRIRWFTPTLEMDLCGHATLATAFVMFNHEGISENTIFFQSRSGILKVTREKNLFTLDFPTDIVQKIESAPVLQCFKENVLEIYKGKTDHLFVFENEEQVRNCRPDFARIAKIGGRGAIITARGHQADFVSRFFGPQAGVDEDPVTGSAHTTLVPYWAGRLGKSEFQALQLSKRGGKLFCKLEGARVKISGTAVLFSTGTIFID
ncbi:MAG: PhzF family phenazine biosynthesis protein [Cytophagales bacterium]